MMQKNIKGKMKSLFIVLSFPICSHLVWENKEKINLLYKEVIYFLVVMQNERNKIEEVRLPQIKCPSLNQSDTWLDRK